jgi:hypothetical protein
VLSSCLYQTAGILSKLATAVMVHPLLLLSVRMLSSPELAGQNWLSAYLTLVTTHGLPILYTGLRISLLCALVPLPPWYLITYIGKHNILNL